MCVGGGGGGGGGVGGVDTLISASEKMEELTTVSVTVGAGVQRRDSVCRVAGGSHRSTHSH